MNTVFFWLIVPCAVVSGLAFVALWALWWVGRRRRVPPASLSRLNGRLFL